MMVRLIGLVSALALVFALVSGAQAVSYVMHDLGFTGCAVGINSSGQAVGCNEQTGSAFLWQGSTTNSLATFGGPRGWANAISESGYIVGGSMASSTGSSTPCSWTGAGSAPISLAALEGIAYGVNDSGWAVGAASGDTACLWHGGASTTVCSGPQCNAWDVNNAGRVVGWSWTYSATEGGGPHAFVWQDNDLDFLPLLQGDAFAYARGINDAGQIVGYAACSKSDRAYLWEDGVPTLVGTLGGVGSQAHAINDRGQIVGSAQNADGAWHAFLKNPDGSMVDLDVPGGALSLAASISDNGWIGGYATDANGFRHATVWEPVPEPASMLSLVCGVGTLGMLCRRRR